MADISDDLMKKQQATDEAHARVRALQGTVRPALAGGRLEREQHAEYDAAWKAWRDAAVEVHAAIGRNESGSRYEVEAALKKAVRYPDTHAEAA
ncbi:hypothetical protein ACFVFJ_44095 [Streptomyces sp. NPDC057717]|uniref:hypothetical protein n=1 Tax=unclassified Streptomyces TaxID=2593676 RepID=UPI003645B30E